MRLAICNETFVDWPLERACQFAAECGYQGLELAPFTLGDDIRALSPARRTDIRRTIESAGLATIGLHWLLARTEGLHWTSPDASVRRATADYLAQLARLCADLGGTLMVLGSPKQRDLAPGMSLQAGGAHALEVLRLLEPVLAKTGVTLCLEPLGPAETNFLNTAAEAAALCRQVDSPYCRLHLDCKAMTSESAPIPDIIAQHAKLLSHFHANDPNRRGPGMGALQFEPILQSLRQCGYTGWVSVEVFDYEPGPERLARESIAYLQRVLSELP